MTAAFDFYAERAFLGFVKNTLAQTSEKSYFPIETAVVSALACASALEGSVNRILELMGNLKRHERSSIRTKIEFLALSGNEPWDWTEAPWSQIKTLIDIRHWLAHYKDSWGGLINRNGHIVTHCDPHAPKFSPHKNLNWPSINEYYHLVCSFIYMLALANGQQEEFEYLLAEDFESVVQTG